ncbi:hypothetical protein ACTODO_00485 [Schaalia dentiphila ATCC 17982]|uniref:Uncharacterized protein n=1 Tax=Schaalia dentiphila ATCC 17982 TaxID=411466 RepID=A7BA28_9ACTO|nr:hypothetical protein ACTODO_00485 [Schaalia odontolytica ATCC 17982]
MGLVSESHGVFGPSNGEQHCCATCNRRSWGGETSSSEMELRPHIRCSISRRWVNGRLPSHSRGRGGVGRSSRPLWVG